MSSAEPLTRHRQRLAFTSGLKSFGAPVHDRAMKGAIPSTCRCNAKSFDTAHATTGPTSRPIRQRTRSRQLVGAPLATNIAASGVGGND